MSSDPSPALDGGAILGLDNVRLELPIAGVGTRSLAALIDYLLLFVVLLLWVAGGAATLGLFDIGGGWMAALLIFGAFVLQWSYFAVLEIVMKGQTPGKSVLGLRVVSYQGGRSSLGAILMRNLIRAVDFYFGLAIMAIDARSRRLGDMAAGTLVIHERPSSDDDVRLRRLPPGWRAEEIVVAESFLRRAYRMHPVRAQALAEKILRWMARHDRDFVAQAGETENIARLTPDIDRVALLARLLQAASPALGPTAPAAEAG